MNSKKMCGFLVTIAFLTSFTLIPKEVQASPITSNTVQVIVNNNNLANVVQPHFTVRNKTYSAIAHLQNNSFNPLNASNKELTSYGYPTKPNNKEDLSIWEKAVSVKLIKPEIARIKTPDYSSKGSKKTNITRSINSKLPINSKGINNTAVSPSRNWAGYEVDTNVTGVNASWQVPAVNAVPYLDTPAYSSQWVGLGGSVIPNASLIQAGDAAQVLSNGSKSYYLWYELFNTSYADGDCLEFTNFTCSPGDNIYTSIETTASSGSNATFLFYIANTTTGYGVSFDVTINDNNQCNVCADWISENNLGSYNPQTVTNNNNCVPFWAAKYQTNIGGNFTSLTSSTSGLLGDVLVNSSAEGSIPVTYNLLSSPTDLSGSNFNINWYNYY